MPRNLGALAGLAALGAMAANRKGADRDTDTGVDVQPSYAQPTSASMNPAEESPDLSRGAPGTSETVTPSAQSLARVQQAVRKPTADMRTMEYRVKDKADSDAMKRAISGADSGTYPDESIRGVKPGPSKAPAARVGRAGQATAERTEKNPMTNETLDAARKKWSESERNSPPSALQRALSGNDVSKSPRVMAQRKKEQEYTGNMKRGGKVIKMAKGGVTRSSASSRADGIASKGHTRGRVI
jgi:hypothetical protein